MNYDQAMGILRMMVSTLYDNTCSPEEEAVLTLNVEISNNEDLDELGEEEEAACEVCFSDFNYYNSFS